MKKDRMGIIRIATDVMNASGSFTTLTPGHVLGTIHSIEPFGPACVYNNDLL